MINMEPRDTATGAGFHPHFNMVLEEASMYLEGRERLPTKHEVFKFLTLPRLCSESPTARVPVYTNTLIHFLRPSL